MCGPMVMTEEQRRYYEGRRHRRERLDLRGVYLHGYGGAIIEIEEGLQKYWVDWQDQPDEIVVDDVQFLYAILLEMMSEGPEKSRLQLFNDAGPAWQWRVGFYRTKWMTNPGDMLGGYIPVFQSVEVL
jgi:hypothetical protein